MSKVRTSWKECLLVGFLVFGLVGTFGVLFGLIGLIYLIRPESVIDLRFTPLVVLVFAVVAASLAGAAFWRRIVATPDASPVRGAFAGLLVGIVAHPLCWFLLVTFQTLRDPDLRAESLYNMAFSVVFASLLMSVSSLAIVGWISAPLGAILGYMTRRIQRRSATSPVKAQTVGMEPRHPLE